MADSTVYVAATHAELRRLLSTLPKVAGASDAVLTVVGLAALGRIRQAFVAKARGGTDEAGDSWAPLSPKTIAYSATRQRGRGGRTKTEKKRASFPSQALNAKQQSRWWEVYRRALAQYRGDRGHAAAVAWLVLKGEGATTLLQKYGGRKVEILRDTGLLLNSLSPGTGSAEQVFRVGGGAVIIGTNRRGAAAHHGGIPGRLPQRRLWPEPNKWPASWWADILDAGKQAVFDLAIQFIRGV